MNLNIPKIPGKKKLTFSKIPSNYLNSIKFLKIPSNPLKPPQIPSSSLKFHLLAGMHIQEAPTGHQLIPQ